MIRNVEGTPVTRNGTSKITRTARTSQGVTRARVADRPLSGSNVAAGGASYSDDPPVVIPDIQHLDGILAHGTFSTAASRSSAVRAFPHAAHSARSNQRSQATAYR